MIEFPFQPRKAKNFSAKNRHEETKREAIASRKDHDR